MSTPELAREFSINQKSSWLFKRKTQEAMKSSDSNPMDRDLGLEDLLIGGLRGKRKGAGKLVAIAARRVKVTARRRANGKGNKEAGRPGLTQIIDWEIELENAGISSGKGMRHLWINMKSSRGHPEAEKEYRECMWC
jgi:hypothetical protein